MMNEVKDLQNKLSIVSSMLLDTIDFENHEELDFCKEEYDLIMNRHKFLLSEMHFDEFIGCVVEDSYKLGYIKACANAGLEIPQ